MLSKSKENLIGTYIKLVDSLVKPVIIYACKCCGESMKKEIFANKFINSIWLCANKYQVFKNLLAISRFYQNSEQIRLKQISKQKFLSILKDFYLLKKKQIFIKTFKEEEFDTKIWVQNLKSLLDMPGLGQNLYIRIYQNITYDKIYMRL